MGVQVSYKKQFLFGIMLLVVVLVVVEGFANIWWYNINTCAFENNELFDQIDDEVKRQLCLENLDLQYTETGITPNQYGSTFYINSYGFRSPEITLEKPENTFRIFTVGGSTTFGSGVGNNESPPAYLQEKFDETELDFKVEVINSGIPGFWSKVESKFIKERLVKFNPDLLIIYDGYNDVAEHSEKKSSANMWAERWIEICDLGKEYGFETIVTLQPFLGTGKKILSESESHLPQETALYNYESYIKQLDKIDPHCATTADLREIFDSVTETLYWDKVHVAPLGNQIVAENFYKLSLPIVLEKGLQTNSIENSGTLSLELTDNNSISENSDWFLGESDLTFRNIIFSYKTPRVYEYLLASYENQLPALTMLNQVNDLDNSLEEINLNQANVNLTQVDLYGLDLSGTNLSNVNLSWLNLTQTKFVKANLTGAKLQGAILTNTNLAGAILNHADLSVANLQGANLAGAILNHADLSVANLQGANLEGAKMIQATLHVANLINANLANANLDGADLFGAYLANANLAGTDIDLSGADLSETNPTAVDFSFSNFTQKKLIDANLTRTNSLDAVDYTISDQNSCESLGGIWNDIFCDLFSFTVKKSDTLQLTNSVIRIHETLDNSGKIILNEGAILNSGGNITNHYGGVITLKSGHIFNNVGTFSNQGIIINGVGEGVTAIVNNDLGVFFNNATGIIFNGNGAQFQNAGVLYNSNIIFNDRSLMTNLSADLAEFHGQKFHDLGGTNFTNSKSLIINNGGGIIFNKPGSMIHNLEGANFTNGNGGLIFFDAGAIINNFSPIKNSNKIFRDCGGMVLDDAPIVEPVIDIPCK